MLAWTIGGIITNANLEKQPQESFQEIKSHHVNTCILIKAETFRKQHIISLPLTKLLTSCF